MAKMKIRKAVFTNGVALATMVTGAALLSQEASATEGYFQHGFGARQSALAGAGVADSSDAMALSLNPAGLTDAGNELQLGLSLFSPIRSFTGSGGPGFTPNGEVESGSKLFPVPNFAYSHQLGEHSAWGIAAYGNGGMNTSYPNLANPACGPYSGVFCGGSLGVNLNQLFIAAGYATEVSDNFKVGISPILAIQAFEANGLGAFAGISSDPTNLTNNETEYSNGFGLRVGAEWDVTDQFRLGATYQTEFDMSEFDKYTGLFEGGGSFNIPATYTVGMAYDVSPAMTVMFDYRHIAYSDIAAIADSTMVPLPLGAPNGPGFSWKDVDAYKLGAEWQTSDAWTWRAGVAINNNPIGGSDVTLNILAPGVQEQHYTGGFTYAYNDTNDFDFAFMYSPESSVSGIEITPQGPNPGHTIELQMHQFQLTVGWTKHF